MNQENKSFAEMPAKNPADAERTKNIRVFTPKVDIYETEETIVLIADVPGVDENSIDVILDKNDLNIRGTAARNEEQGRRLSYTEYDVGDYQRTFTLSEEVDRENIEASVKNGVLRIVLRKAQPVQAKKIAIKAG